MKKIWPFSFYFLYFAAFAALLPFLVLFYQQLGFSGAQIGMLTGVPPLITLFAAPFLSGVADSKQRHKSIMSLGIAVAVLVGVLLPALSSFIPIFIVIALFNLFMSPVASLADSATMSMLGTEKATYGRIRLGGTIGWGLFAPIAGALVQNQGLRVAFWTFSAIMLVNILVSSKFVYGSTEGGQSGQGGIRALLANRRWTYFLPAAFLAGIGAFSVASYLFPYMEGLGATETTMGLALTIATLTEIPVFFFGDRLVKRFTSRGLFTLALALIGVRSLCFAIASTPWMVLIVQVFGGMIFPAMWLSGVAYADEIAPEGLKSTAQGLFSAVTFGFGSAVSGFIGGILLESIGGRGMFLVFGIIILVGLALIEGIKRIYARA
jgi:PPP family 3-phenylpropionic acid transporter